MFGNLNFFWQNKKRFSALSPHSQSEIIALSDVKDFGLLSVDVNGLVKVWRGGESLSWKFTMDLKPKSLLSKCLVVGIVGQFLCMISGGKKALFNWLPLA